MLRYCTLLLCTLLVCASSVEKETSKVPGTQIFNTSASLGQFPWQAGIIYYMTNGDTHFMGGAIIAPEWVLTRYWVTSEIESVQVYTGQIVLKGDVGFVSAGVQFLEHEANFTTIQLIKLGSPLQFNENVKAIVIGDDELGADIEVVVSGWDGNYGSLPKSDILSYAYQNTLSNADCAAILENPINSEMVCTNYGTQSVTLPCDWNYGSPLVSNFHASPTLVGLLQYAYDDCQAGRTSPFVRVSPHIDWIREQTGI